VIWIQCRSRKHMNEIILRGPNYNVIILRFILGSRKANYHVALGNEMGAACWFCLLLLIQSPEALEYTRQIKEKLKAAEYLGKFSFGMQDCGESMSNFEKWHVQAINLPSSNICFVLQNFFVSACRSWGAKWWQNPNHGSCSWTSNQARRQAGNTQRYWLSMNFLLTKFVSRIWCLILFESYVMKYCQSRQEKQKSYCSTLQTFVSTT
jgi:hypothetical protein